MIGYDGAMTVVTLPADLQAWAEGEVAAGRARSLDQLAAVAVADYRRRWEGLRKSLDDAEAEANEKGWLDAEEVFAEIEANLEAREAFEAARAVKDSKRA